MLGGCHQASCKDSRKRRRLISPNSSWPRRAIVMARDCGLLMDATRRDSSSFQAGDRSLGCSLTGVLGQASASSPEQQDLFTFKSQSSNSNSYWKMALASCDGWDSGKTRERSWEHSPSPTSSLPLPQGLGGWSKEAVWTSYCSWEFCQLFQSSL